MLEALLREAGHGFMQEYRRGGGHGEQTRDVDRLVQERQQPADTTGVLADLRVFRIGIGQQLGFRGQRQIVEEGGNDKVAQTVFVTVPPGKSETALWENSYQTIILFEDPKTRQTFFELSLAADIIEALIGLKAPGYTSVVREAVQDNCPDDKCRAVGSPDLIAALLASGIISFADLYWWHEYEVNGRSLQRIRSIGSNAKGLDAARPRHDIRLSRRTPINEAAESQCYEALSSGRREDIGPWFRVTEDISRGSHARYSYKLSHEYIHATNWPADHARAHCQGIADYPRFQACYAANWQARGTAQASRHCKRLQTADPVNYAATLDRGYANNYVRVSMAAPAQPSVLSTHVRIGLKECTEFCSASSECASFTYDRRERLCTMSSGTIPPRDLIRPAEYRATGDQTDDWKVADDAFYVDYFERRTGDEPSVPVGYRHFPNTAISGHNERTVRGSVQDCAEACSNATDFVCKSFDYIKASKSVVSDQDFIQVGRITSDSFSSSRAAVRCHELVELSEPRSTTNQEAPFGTVIF